MNEDLSKEIEEMENLISGDAETLEDGVVATSAPSSEAPSTEAPSSSAPGTAAPVTAAPEDGVGEPATSSNEQSPESSFAAMKAELDELRALLTKKDTEPEVKPKVPEEVADEDFVGGLDIDEVTRDPDEFNKVLNSIYKKAVDRARAEISSRYESMPKLIQDNIEVITAVKKRTEQFYTDNKDLEPFKKVVQTVYEELAKPGKDHEELLKEVATETRKRLNIQAPQKTQPKDTDKPPRLQQKGRQQRPQQTKTDHFQGELDAMETALNS